MSQARINQGIATRREIDVQLFPRPVSRPVRSRRQDLESKIAVLQQDYAELHTAIFEAAQIHRRLCAPRLVRHGEFEIASEIFAVRHLPGDFFTVQETGAGLTMALGDICGKGLAAGMWTTYLVRLIAAHASANSRPEVVMAAVNRDVCSREPFLPLASLFLASLHSATGVLNYCSAGHPPALLLRADGKLETLSEGGMLLGAMSTAAYVGGCVQLNAGDVLLVYSDGITESQNLAGEEFGETRLETQLRGGHSGDANAVLFSVLGAVQDFAAANPLIDDMSVAVVRRTVH
ncbi:MAG TPA: PP2C family protein-serine/threonine phosphatase [Pyrinomonadaceae bacterium]|nr:PP2C family protein-serine/threonine phosphatase [Pyrinomonadaceae bacterium]